MIKALGGISFFNLYVPTLLVFVLIAVGLMTLPQQLSAYRRQGVLRRMSTTPVHPSWVLAAQTAVSVIMAVIGLMILLGAGAGELHPRVGAGSFASSRYPAHGEEIFPRHGMRSGRRGAGIARHVAQLRPLPR